MIPHELRTPCNRILRIQAHGKTSVPWNFSFLQYHIYSFLRKARFIAHNLHSVVPIGMVVIGFIHGI